MRFGFGRNWQGFLRHLSEDRVSAACGSLKDLLRRNDLSGVRMLDAGCGSGLFSLAAIRLGAMEVVSFDYDVDSVACAQSLNERFGPYRHWDIRQGSVLDRDWLTGLGQFDLVYSWGVLHHTGSMWEAIDAICHSVKPGGILCISIYNDQGAISTLWTLIKRLYNVSPRWIRFLIVLGYLIPASMLFAIKGILRARPPGQWFPIRNERGMHYYYDVVDWVGGYPFETATPEAINRYLQARGFAAENVVYRGGSGCNEFVFKRRSV